MSTGSGAREDRRARLLRELGQRVRARREASGRTRHELAAAAGLSARFLAALEAGSGNISVARLADLALALASTPAELLAEPSCRTGTERPRVVALLGLRGAGKSTVGAALARRLDVPFVELDDLVAEAAGMATAPIFELHGERYFRRLERETLARFLAGDRAAVLAAGGGIVTEPATYALLRRQARTVWLRASARDHWDRVVAQGDRRPMADRAQAMDELEALLAEREPLYALADVQVDTSALTVTEAVARLAGALLRSSR